ncbi:hypothetical protein ACHAXR_009736 [Thalassiosira sp. AJA248-18]
MTISSTLVPLATTAAHAAFNLPAFAIRGGAAAAEFDMGLAKTRLEGLAYSTVTTLMMNAALRLFSSTPKKLEPIPTGNADQAKAVRLNNYLKVAFSLCISLSVALGAYTTTVFALMSIYSKTALGMGLQKEYLDFFSACAPYRVSGFASFIGTLATYNIGWILSLILNYEGEIRWWIALPAVIVGVIGLIHYRSIIGIAGATVYG